ncbi:helix-turn-helix domain-containing protein [Shouchella clausii]|uniref:helix-turn-helix domain-containing protein n=1 Tax=Shouchella clausii TaxID=79880 RepID=UPI001C7302CD|nr:helix-turn-helix transcriptional regulator [Shouchella clausii]MBX0320165.1 helix-turn-helix domain-containing protein [Shouchella clausii]
MKKISIEMSDELHREILFICEYFNKKEQFYNRKETTITVESFIQAAIKERLILIDKIVNSNLKHKDFSLKNNFKKMFKDSNISQSELSERTGIPISTISSILTNRSQPTMDHFFKLWEALYFPNIFECFYREKEGVNE